MSLKNNNPYDEQFEQEPPNKKKGNQSKQNKGLLPNVSGLFSDTFRGRGTGYGSSSYDKDLNWDADVDQSDIQDSLNEFRAQNQPWINKFGAGVTRAALKGGSEIAKLPGVIGGILMTPFADDGEGFDTAFNNSWIKSIDEFQDETKQEYLPVYVKKAVREGNLLDNISSIDFWATDGADGIGYILAMMAPGALIESVNLGSKLITSAGKLAKSVGMLKKVEDATNVLSKLGITPKNINFTTSVAANTIFESGAEAKSVSDSIMQDANNKLELGKLGKPGGISQEEYDYIVNVQRPIAMRDTFISNAAILVGPNAIMHKAIWGKSLEKFTKSTDKIKDRIIASTKRYGKAFLTEGFWEEGSQTTVENYFTDKALKSELGKGSDFNIGELSKSYIDTISTTEGQKAIFLGGILGGAMTSIQGRRNDVRNKKITNSILDNIDNSISSFNNIFDNEIYKKDESGNFIFQKDEDGNDTTKRIVDPVKVLEKAISLDYIEDKSNLLDIALQNSDTELLNSIKKQTIFDLILPSIYNGEAGIETLKNKLENNSLFQEIIERDQTIESKNETKEFINNTLKLASYLQKENEKFKNFSKELISLDNDNVNENDKNDFLNQLNSKYLDAKYKLELYKDDLKKQQLLKKDIFDEININPNLSIEEIESNELLYNDYINKNPLLKNNLEKINNLTNKISEIQKDISEIWQGTNNDKIKNSFNEFIKDRNDFRNNFELLEPEINNTIDNIKNSENLVELLNIENEIDDKIKPYVEDHIIKRKNELNELQLDIVSQLNEDFNNENENSTIIDNNEKESFETSVIYDNFEQNLETNHDESINNSKKLQDSLYKKLHNNNYRIISKNKNTGEKFDFINKEWIEYENNPINKIGTELFFTLNENPGDNKSLKLASELGNFLLNNENDINNKINYIITSDKNEIKSLEELREFLTNYLPLNLGFKDSLTKAPIDTLPNNNNKEGDNNNINIFNKTIKLQRLKIVNEILKGNKLDNISTNIIGQMPGVLQLDTTNENEIPENSITQLQYFQLNNFSNEKGELTKEGYQYIRENLYVVSDFGNIQNAKGNVINYNNKEGQPLSKGEFYLKIPMTNGQPFYLKLNSKLLSEKKANVIYEIFKYRFNNESIVNKSLKLEELNNTNPELLSLIKSDLYEEYNTILKIKKSDQISLKDIIDILIYDNNNSNKVKFNFTGTGNKGENKLQYGNNSIYSQEELENKKEEFIEWIITNKRQNIKFGKPNNINDINTNNKEYLDYLLINNIINTNAVVGKNEDGSLKQTFSGYSNIYWKNLNIKSLPKEIKQEDLTKDEIRLLGIRTGSIVEQISLDEFLNGTSLNNEKKQEIILNNENNFVSLHEKNPNIQFSHEIKGTEENKLVEKMQNKIHEKDLNLSDEQIDKFIELEEFSKLIEMYSQENNIREDDLLNEDYIKIIESNYTKEQIYKICKK